MTLKRKKLTLLLVFLLLLLFSAAPALASTVYFDSANGEAPPGQSLQADLFLNAGGKNINAIEGKIIFPSDILKLIRTAEGGSAVSLWVKKPELESENQIVFSGGLPGGFSSEKGLLFSAVFRVKENVTANNGRITAENLKAYLDDGRGTPVNIPSSSFHFIVAEKESAGTPELEETEETKDTNPPEPFVPYIGRNPTVYDNQWFVAFIAQDQEWGIDHYEVWETAQKYDINNMDNIKEAEWAKAENPRLLRDQNLGSYVYVKAVDKAGNERIEILLPGKNNSAGYKTAVAVLMAVSLLFIISALVYKILGIFRKRTQK